MKLRIYIVCTLLLVGLVPAVSQEAAIYDWLVMVYMNGDCDLEKFAMKDIEEMERGLSKGANIAVVVQIDRAFAEDIGGYFWDDATNGNWTDCRRFLIQPNKTGNIDSKELMNVGEQNMGKGETVLDFVKFATTFCPSSRNQALIFWDHGTGVFTNKPVPGIENMGVAGEGWPKNEIIKGICYDYHSSKDGLEIEELRSVMPQIARLCGEDGKIELLGYDACMMQMLEYLLEYRNYASVIVGSEEKSPGYGWDYESILNELSRDGQMDSLELGKIIVKSYETWYMNKSSTYASSENPISISAIDTSKLNDLEKELSKFTDKITGDMDKYHGLLADVRDRCEYFSDLHGGSRYSAYKDLYDFVELCGIEEEGLKELSDSVMNAINETVIIQAELKHRYHGISIAFPLEIGDNIDKLDGLEISKTGWTDMLRAFDETGKKG